MSIKNVLIKKTSYVMYTSVIANLTRMETQISTCLYMNKFELTINTNTNTHIE